MDDIEEEVHADIVSYEAHKILRDIFAVGYMSAEKGIDAQAALTTNQDFFDDSIDKMVTVITEFVSRDVTTYFMLYDYAQRALPKRQFKKLQEWHLRNLRHD